MNCGASIGFRADWDQWCEFTCSLSDGHEGAHMTKGECDEVNLEPNSGYLWHNYRLTWTTEKLTNDQYAKRAAGY